jgi:hypothetical protein
MCEYDRKMTNTTITREIPMTVEKLAEDIDKSLCHILLAQQTVDGNY